MFELNNKYVYVIPHSLLYHKRSVFLLDTYSTPFGPSFYFWVCGKLAVFTNRASGNCWEREAVGYSVIASLMVPLPGGLFIFIFTIL